ncbi:hypothetical protein Patl1_34819 [Pistacia atlantica]|uniref:Uncharacterized protein n=1 Tax=Pistacia atlantica TaxID=434234 RepID=A0ACC0ZV99_9ROSI|nr:hypothetical protein Patl1_34819 [Pistacia atlantica]
MLQGNNIQLIKILVFKITCFPREYCFNWLVRHSLRSHSSILSSSAGQQVPANQKSGVQGYIFPQGIPFQLAASDSYLQDSDLDILPSGFFFGPLIKGECLLAELNVLELIGLKRHLTSVEIVERDLRYTVGYAINILNMVSRGNGRATSQCRNVIKASDIMVHEQGLHFSPHKVTVSTNGFVPQLKRFLHESNCALAVSLNATTDEVRNWIMSINWNLLLETLREELHFKHNYKVLFEYVMLAVINDRIQQNQTDSSISESIQAAASPAPLVQTVPFPPKTQIFCPLSQTAAAWTVHPLSPLAKEFIPCHVVQGNFGQSQTIAPIQPASRLTSPAYTFDLDKPPQPSGRGCFFCKRDLSFTPEADGPISQPSIPPSVGVLPCGHYFHSCCLEIVTPPEKSTDPPCIICDLHENASRRPIFSQVFSVPFSISNLSGISQNIGGIEADKN